MRIDASFPFINMICCGVIVQSNKYVVHNDRIKKKKGEINYWVEFESIRLTINLSLFQYDWVIVLNIKMINSIRYDSSVMTDSIN
jgi:hypothetical protein